VAILVQSNSIRTKAMVRIVWWPRGVPYSEARLERFLCQIRADDYRRRRLCSIGALTGDLTVLRVFAGRRGSAFGSAWTGGAREHTKPFVPWAFDRLPCVGNALASIRSASTVRRMLP
jgi:hypothetical protein